MTKCYDLPRVKITVMGGVVTYEIEGDVIVEVIDLDVNEYTRESSENSQGRNYIRCALSDKAD